MISRALSDLAILELAATELHVYNSTDEALRQHYCVHIQQGHPQRTYCPAVFMRNSLCSRSARSSGALLDIVFPLPRAPDKWHAIPQFGAASRDGGFRGGHRSVLLLQHRRAEGEPSGALDCGRKTLRAARLPPHAHRVGTTISPTCSTQYPFSPKP